MSSRWMRNRRKLSVPCCCRRVKRAGESVRREGSVFISSNPDSRKPIEQLIDADPLWSADDIHLEAKVLNHLPGFVRRHTRRGEITADEERVGRIERQRLQG